MVYKDSISMMPEIELAENNIQFIRLQAFSLSEVEGNSVQNRFLVKVNDRLFYVGDLIYAILKQISTGSGLQAIARSLTAHTGQEATQETADIINSQITPMFSVNARQRKNPVKNVGHVLNPERIHFIVKPLSKLYSPKVFAVLLAIGVLANIFLIVAMRAQWIPAGPAIPVDIQHYLLYIAGVLGFIVFHEIGHAAAASYYGVLPKKIGFGIYFLFPAFYTDLTDIWKLPRKERIVINMGGIYLQLLVNILLFVVAININPEGEWYYFIRHFMLFNIIISIYNVNPFFRFDGYWVYSDYFDLPNLRQRSMRLVGYWWQRLRGKAVQNQDAKKASLWIYTVLYLVFMGFIWITILRLVGNVHFKATYILPKMYLFDYTRLSDWQQAGVPLFIVALFWTIIGYKLFKKFKRRSYAKQ